MLQVNLHEARTRLSQLVVLPSDALDAAFDPAVEKAVAALFQNDQAAGSSP